MEDFLDNRAKSILHFTSCKVNIMLFSSLLNMITASLGRCVGG